VEKLFPDAWLMIQQNVQQFNSGDWQWSWQHIDIGATNPVQSNAFYIEGNPRTKSVSGNLLIASLISKKNLYAQYFHKYFAVVFFGIPLLGIWIYILVCLRFPKRE
jgi:hypothetical protein